VARPHTVEVQVAIDRNRKLALRDVLEKVVAD
jgi:hypothetical protein